MARELRWWLAGAFVACAIVAVGYLSPSGAAPAAAARSRQPEPSAARLRARGLAEQWRAADLAVRLAVYRRRLEPELARRRATDQPGPALLVEAPDSVPVHTRALVAAALDTVWRELGLGVSKVAVGVVWISGDSPGPARTPARRCRVGRLATSCPIRPIAQPALP